MKSLDQYEFTGILVPGVIALYGLARMFPETVGLVGEKDFSVGELGLFVVLAYAAGHLVQAIGKRGRCELMSTLDKLFFLRLPRYGGSMLMDGRRRRNG